jgi:uncharacterized membrane protein YciS (DUF1049 family)
VGFPDPNGGAPMTFKRWMAEARWRASIMLGVAFVAGTVMGMTFEWGGVVAAVIASTVTVGRTTIARRAANKRTDVAS